MRYAPLVFALGLLALAGCNKNETGGEKADKKDDDTPGVHLKAEEIEGLGLTKAPAASVTYLPGVSGYGVVTALDTIAQADADLVTAQAAATQSEAASARARSLATGPEAAISQEQAQVAQAKAAADQAALALARRKADAAFGLNPPWRDAASRSRIMAALGNGRAVLVRATFPLGSLGPGVPRSLSVTPLDSPGTSLTARQIWDAPADPAVPGRSFYLLLDNGSSGAHLAQGQRVAVTAPTGTAMSGILIPASALVLSASQSWAYVETKPGTFLRVPVDISKPLPGGYFQPAGGPIKAGQAIVTSGAGLLLARETNPSTEPEE